MRILVVVVLAVIAIASAGVWALGQFGDNLTSSVSEGREPLVREAEVVAAADPAPAAPALSSPKPSAAKEKAAAPAAAKAEPAPPPAQTTAPEAAAPQASAPATPADAPAAQAAPTPAKPNPLKPSTLNSTGPAQILPSARSTGAPAAADAAPAAPSPAAEAAPAPPPPAPAQATAQSAPAADPIVKPQQVQAAAPATATAVAAAGDLQSQYRSRKLTYNRPPQKLALDKTIDIALIINSTGQNQAAEALKNLPGTVVERNVDLSDFVAAELKGNDFDVVLQSVAPRQKLSPNIANEWRWRVTPRAPGPHTLTLTVYGYASGSDDAEPLDSYRDDINVEVQQLDQVIGWAKGVQPLFAVLAALAGAISASVAFLRFRDERKAKKKA